MSRPECAVYDEILDLLRASGVPWSTTNGKRHVKLYVGGRFVQAVSRATGQHHSSHGDRNALARVRRAIREYQCGGTAGVNKCT
jgi:hypothetical protein